VSELGVGEDAGGDLASSGGAVAASEVVAHDAEVVEGDVSEERAACAIAESPNAGGGSLEAVIDLDEAASVTARPLHRGRCLRCSGFDLWMRSSMTARVPVLITILSP
jgi:hypothetical protein